MITTFPPLVERMKIEQFVAQSEGQWRSMRSGHSLAFQQFEDVLSDITIQAIAEIHPDIKKLLQSSFSETDISSTKVVAPFKMEWSAESDWEPDDPTKVSQGSCLILPIPDDEISGILVRSVGYAESESANSHYRFLNDGTFVLTTKYEQSIAEERIWFASENVRCRSSVLRTSAGSGILQTSFASEVRRIQAT